MAVAPPTAAECELASSTAENPFPGECGRFDASLLGQQRIAGGRPVPRGLVPWQAQIRICGATIIDELHLLTAATCTTYPRNLIGTKVYAGHIVTDGLSMAEDAECTRQERTIESVSVHPCHCPSRDTLCGSASSPGVGSMIKAYQYDIAILTVNEPFNFNTFVQPICLPSVDFQVAVGTTSWASGFGGTPGGKFNNTRLRLSEQRVLSNKDCYATSDRICTEASIGPCILDDGGPLVVNMKANRIATLIGITSYGFGCDSPFEPEYTRVTEVVKWIQNDIKKKEVSQGENAYKFDEGQCYKYLVNQNITVPTTMPTSVSPAYPPISTVYPPISVAYPPISAAACPISTWRNFSCFVLSIVSFLLISF